MEVIANGVDLNRFKPREISLVREVMGLPSNKKIILFGAMDATTDPWKGFKYLKSALDKFQKFDLRNQIELVVFGASEPEKPSDFRFPVRYIGKLHDEISISLLYAAADVFIAPSVRDNLPFTVMESMSCGTPCVAFEIGGMPDMIDHKKNGYLARPFDTNDLAKGIEFVLYGNSELSEGKRSGAGEFLDKERIQRMRQKARKKAEDMFDLETCAGSYLKLYEEILRNA